MRAASRNTCKQSMQHAHTISRHTACLAGKRRLLAPVAWPFTDLQLHVRKRMCYVLQERWYLNAAHNSSAAAAMPWLHSCSAVACSRGSGAARSRCIALCNCAHLATGARAR
jgi:hypothetical protein